MLRMGIIGNGRQVRNEFLPYLEERIKVRHDIEIVWGSGCKCLPHELPKCPLNKYGDPDEEGHDEDWKELLNKKQVDVVLVSGPNSIHAGAIQRAIENGIHVAVDKPTTIHAADCAELVRMAEDRQLVFVTISQRRYEEVYQVAADLIRNGQLGEPVVIDYLIAHQDFERGKDPPSWWKIWSMSGGGVLMHSGYHGIDTVYWLLRQYTSEANWIRPVSVSCRYMLDTKTKVDPGEETEILADCRITLSNGSLFNVVAYCHTQKGSLDENIKIFGTKGAIRIMRDRPVSSRVPAEISFQENSGRFMRYESSHWEAKRYAPLEEFLNEVIQYKPGQKPSVLSPAADSYLTIRTIEAAYESARNGGKEIQI